MASASPTMFDTYAYSQRLKGVGFTETQVDAMTTGLNEIAMARVATKDDLRDLENRLVIRVVGAGAVIATIAVGVIKLA